METLKWLRSQVNPCPFCNYCFQRSACTGKLEILQWLHSTEKTIFDEQSSLCGSAVDCNDLSVLKWLRSLDPPCPWNEDVCREAAACNFPALEWLRTQDPPCPWNSGVYEACIVNDRFDHVEWIHRQYPPCPLDESVCKAAACYGTVQTLEWLRSRDPPCPWNLSECWVEAASNGNFSAVKWLRDRHPHLPFTASFF